MGFEVHSYSIQHQWKDRNDPKELVTCSRERGPDLTTPKLKLDTQLPETEVRPSWLQQGYCAARDTVVGLAVRFGIWQVIWTYDVTWKLSNQRWVSRWDVYLQIADDQVVQ